MRLMTVGTGGAAGLTEERPAYALRKIHEGPAPTRAEGGTVGSIHGAIGAGRQGGT